MDGIENGFFILDPDINIKSYECNNYFSAENSLSKPLLDKFFKDELDLGRISRVFSKPHCVHALGAVEKKGLSSLRPITDCSLPRQDSINAHMDYPKQRFKSIDSACDLMSPGCWMASIYICQAYRHIPVHPSQRSYQGFRWMFGKLECADYDYFVDNFLCFGLSCAPGIFSRIISFCFTFLNLSGGGGVYIPIHPSLWSLFGIKWDSKLYFYTRFPFGSRSSPFVFNTLAEAIVWILQSNYGVPHLLHLLDDFLRIESPTSGGDQTMSLMSPVFNKLGIPISTHKTMDPVQVLEYLGILLDTMKMEARLPPDKLTRITQCCVKK